MMAFFFGYPAAIIGIGSLLGIREINNRLQGESPLATKIESTETWPIKIRKGAVILVIFLPILFLVWYGIHNLVYSLF